MKRIKWLMLLCAFAVFFASPGWAATQTHDVVLSNDASFKKLSTDIGSAGAGDVFNLSMASGYDSVDVGTTGIIVTKKITLNGNNVVFNGHSKDRELSLFTFSGDAAGSTVTNLTIKNTVLKDPTVKTGGAAIFINGVNNITITGASFINNAISGDKQKGDSQYVGGAGIYVKDATGTIIKNSKFTGNSMALSGEHGGSAEDGGAAIYNYASAKDTSVDIIDCEFSENTWSKGAAKVNGSGGAIANVISTAGRKITLNIENSSFDKNWATRYGGAIYSVNDAAGSIDITIKGTSFTNNELKGYKNNGSFGGAIGCFGASSGIIELKISDSIFKGNKALNTGLNSQQTGAGGGAVCLFTLDPITSKTSADIKNCLFDGNESNMGGALVNWGNSGSAYMTVTNCTFTGNKAISDDIFAKTSKAPYPIGGALLTRANADGNSPSVNGSAVTKIINCTFENNSSVSGGTIANYKDSGSAALTDIINSTFVSNVTSPDKATDVYNMGSGDIKILNTLLWNTTAANIISTDKGTVSLDYSALPSGATFTSDKITNTNSKDISSAPTSKEVELNGIKHKIFIPTSELAAGKYTADTTPEYDILGVKRSTSKPTIGAVELASTSGYTIVASDDSTPSILQSDGITLSADISTDFKVTFKVSSDTAIDSTYKVTWSGTLDISGLTFSSADATITGTPTASVSADFKPIATITTAGGYVIETVSKDFTIKITSADTGEEEGSTSETITLSAESTDVTVYQGGSIDITVTATSGDNIVWSNSGTLPSGDFTVTSASKTYTITGTVSSSATAGAYTYKVIASNDTNVASVDIKITVKAKEAEKETETTTTYTPSVTVSPDKLSLDKGATSGNTLTVTMTISPDTTFTPSYQWYSNTTASTSGGTAISSATSATYTVPTDTTGTFYYFVIAATTLSDASITAASNIVTVTITGGGDTTPDYANMSADEVANLAVDEDGTISQDIVDALLEALTSSDGAVSLTDVAASEQLVAIYAASAKAQEGVVNLSTLPLNSLSGIGTLLNNIATANNTNTSEMTLDLAGQDAKLTKVDGLSGVSLKGLSLKGNVNIAEVDLKGATVEKVEMSNSGVATLALDSTSDVKEIDANGSALATIDLASNDNIQSLDIGGTQVSTLNASGCSNLANLAAEGGSSTGTPGDLKELNIEGCESLTNLSVSNNQLLGIKKPSTLKNRVAVSARGQRRPNARFTSSSFNFWNFLWALLGNTGSYSATTATFNVTKITTITYTVGTTTTSADVPASGDLSFSGTPTGISYEYDTSDFGPSTGSSLQSASVVAADDSGMDVTLGTVGSSSGGSTEGEVTLGSSGGGCDAGFGLGALPAVMLMFALKKKRS